MKHNSLALVLLFSFALGNACSKKFDPQNGVLVETIQASSYLEGHRPENVFISGKSWKPLPSKAPEDGITFFFSNASKLDQQGTTVGFGEIDAIKLGCPSSSVQKYYVYVNASYRGSTTCGEKLSIKGFVHSLFVSPSPEKKTDTIELDELEFYRNDKKATVLFPIGIEGKVVATSIADPKEGYPAYNLFDGAKEFGWVEGKPDDGIGESVTVDLEKEITLSGLEIYNGYQRSVEHYAKNGRVEKLGISNGQESVSVKLSDVSGAQRVLLPKPLSGKQFKFTIESAWTGEKWKDTAISEMIFLGPNFERYTVSDSQYLAKEQSTIDRSKGTLIGEILGSRLYSEDCVNDGGRSVAFRPNGSFVYWEKLGGTTGVDTVMDGNWILEKSSKGDGQIYVFGRLYQVFRTLKDYGAGPYDSENISEESKTEIFSDRIKISKEDVPSDCDGSVSQAFVLKGNKIYGSFH